MASEQSTPYGFCQCGCGKKTTIAKGTSAANGAFRGEPMRYVVGHYSRVHPPAAARCERCQALFKPRTNRDRYCTPECGRAAAREKNVAKKRWVSCVCRYCGTMFEAKGSPTRRDRVRYCSHACMWKAKQTVTYEYRPCFVCGVPVQVHPTSPFKRKYCSRACYFVVMRLKLASKDGNHNQIAEAFRSVGASVIDTHAIGRGFPDMLVCFRRQVYMVEVKNPTTQYGRKGLNPLQIRLRDEGWPVWVVRTPDEAMAIILKRRAESPSATPLLPLGIIHEP